MLQAISFCGLFYFFFQTGMDEITELFFYRVASLVVEPGIYILIQKEVLKMFIINLIIFIARFQCFNNFSIFVQALRKFNLILGKMTASLKKNMKIATSQEASDIQYVMSFLHFYPLLYFLSFEYLLLLCLFVFQA